MGESLECTRVKVVTGNFDIAIIALGQLSLRVVLSARSYRCFIRAAWATCGQWCHMRLNVVPHLSSGVGLEALWIRLFSGLPTCGHPPHSEPGPRLQSEPDLPLELDVWCAHSLHLAEWASSWGLGPNPTRRPILVQTRAGLVLTWCGWYPSPRVPTISTLLDFSYTQPLNSLALWSFSHY
jgi:hypothetical protein